MGEAIDPAFATYMRMDRKKQRPKPFVYYGIKIGMLTIACTAITLMGLLLCNLGNEAFKPCAPIGMLFAIIYMTYQVPKTFQSVARDLNDQRKLGTTSIKLDMLIVAFLSYNLLCVALCSTDHGWNGFCYSVGMLLAVIYMAYQIPASLKNMMNRVARFTRREHVA